MLERWSIENFKSLKAATLDIGTGSVDIVAGINSAGKSSILQSMLFMCQSLETGRIAPNGRLVRLGSADDILAEGEERLLLRAWIPEAESRRTSFARRSPVHGKLRDADVSFILGKAAGDNDDLVPLIVKELHISARPSLEAARTSEFSEESMKSLAGSFFLMTPSIDFVRTDGAVPQNVLDANEIEADAILRLSSEGVPDSGKCDVYVAMQGFSPSAVLFKVDRSWISDNYESELGMIFESLVVEKGGVEDLVKGAERRRVTLRNLDRASYTHAVKRLLTSRIQRLSQDAGVDDYQEVLSDDVSEDKLQEYARLAVSRHIDNPWACVRVGPDRNMNLRSDDFYTQACEEAFAFVVGIIKIASYELFDIPRRLKYIGPLREEPRPMTEVWDELDRNLPVGKNGQLAPYVLSARGAESVTCSVMHPDGRGDVRPVTRESSLSEAVRIWASYIGLGGNLRAESHGNLGISIKVGEGKGRDLTMVGVGVSQLTPVIVGVLACPKGSIVVLEQPELHLHPSAQSRLADFLLFARTDITLVVETHSAALITRMRRRAAEADNDDDLLSRMHIVFVERGEQDNLSRARNLEFDAYGNLSDWPRGFMDTIEEDTQRILDANMRRRGRRMATR